MEQTAQEKFDAASQQTAPEPPKEVDAEVRNTGVASADEAIRLDMDLSQLAGFIGIDGNFTQHYDKLETVLAWGKSKGKDIVDVMSAVRSLRDSLGFKEEGTAALNKLYAWIRMTSDQARLFQELRKISKAKELLKG